MKRNSLYKPQWRGHPVLATKQVLVDMDQLSHLDIGIRGKVSSAVSEDMFLGATDPYELLNPEMKLQTA